MGCFSLFSVSLLLEEVFVSAKRPLVFDAPASEDAGPAQWRMWATSWRQLCLTLVRMFVRRVLSVVYTGRRYGLAHLDFPCSYRCDEAVFDIEVSFVNRNITTDISLFSQCWISLSFV